MDQTEKKPLRVAVQGYAGAFHDLAAHLFFAENRVESMAFDEFSELIDAVEKGASDACLMAVENSIVGSLDANYRLIAASDLAIFGEIFLRIEQNLMALPGSKIADLEEIRSHPVALGQCHDFFRKWPRIRLVSGIDTALCASDVSLQKLEKVGAVASKRAAEIYGLEILAAGIEDNPRNFTRFLALRKKQNGRLKNEGATKISVAFELPHRTGTLHRVLAVLAENEANLTKIQSAPLVGNEWQYRFFVDFVLEKGERASDVFFALGHETSNLKLLGVYAEGRHFD